MAQKKKNKAASGPKKAVSDVASAASALKEVNINKEEAEKEEEPASDKASEAPQLSASDACAACGLPKATKRCTKRHMKCLKKVRRFESSSRSSFNMRVPFREMVVGLF